MPLYDVDVPCASEVYLPDSFREVMSSMIVNTHLALVSLIPCTYHKDYIDSIRSGVDSIYLFDRTCNEPLYTVFDFSRFEELEQLVISNDSFLYVQTFVIDGLNSFKILKIGSNCFTKEKLKHENDPDRSFHIVNCPLLETIDIGSGSFVDYGGEFELSNLPSLLTLSIGTLEEDSYNFFSCQSFALKNLCSLKSVVLGKFVFQNSLKTIFEGTCFVRITIRSSQFGIDRVR